MESAGGFRTQTAARANYLTVNRTVIGFFAGLDRDVTTLEPGLNFTPLASRRSPATTQSASSIPGAVHYGKEASAYYDLRRCDSRRDHLGP